jgi:hypothetical protein
VKKNRRQPEARRAKAKHSKPVNKQKLTRQTKGFGFVAELQKGAKCTMCQKYMTKGTCAITYHVPNNGAGRTSKYHANIKCLAMLGSSKQYEFAEKKWTESEPRRLAEELLALNAE